MITKINIMDGSIIRQIELDCWPCTYGIYKIKKGYIIYGELEVIMLDFNFNELWRFSGADILNYFELCEDKIKLSDWQNNNYEIDFDGNSII